MRPVKWFYVSIININNLCKSYGSNVVLSGVDLKVGSGDAVSIIGSNGAGKSTLIKCALLLTKPSSGTIEVWTEHSQSFTLSFEKDQDRDRGSVSET
jgi:ABC-type multidrug transport system ATPase subunit